MFAIANKKDEAAHPGGVGLGGTWDASGLNSFVEREIGSHAQEPEVEDALEPTQKRKRPTRPPIPARSIRLRGERADSHSDSADTPAAPPPRPRLDNPAPAPEAGDIHVLWPDGSLKTLDDLPAPFDDFARRFYAKFRAQNGFRGWWMGWHLDRCAASHVLNGRASSRWPDTDVACGSCRDSRTKVKRPCFRLDQDDRTITLLPEKDALGADAFKYWDL